MGGSLARTITSGSLGSLNTWNAPSACRAAPGRALSRRASILSAVRKQLLAEIGRNEDGRLVEVQMVEDEDGVMEEREVVISEEEEMERDAATDRRIENPLQTPMSQTVSFGNLNVKKQDIALVGMLAVAMKLNAADKAMDMLGLMLGRKPASD